MGRENIFGVELDRYTRSEIARKAGVAPARVSELARGERALSLGAAKKIAEGLGGDKPLTLWIRSHLATVKKAKQRAPAPGAPDSELAALRAALAVLRELKKVPREDLLLEGDELAQAIRELAAMLPDALTNATTDANTGNVATKQRDAFGRLVPEPQGDTRRDVYGRRYSEPEGVERDCFGSAMPKP